MLSASRQSFFFNDTATTEIYTLSLHDALPIYDAAGIRDLAGHPHQGTTGAVLLDAAARPASARQAVGDDPQVDRKSTRLNSSHANISYAVFCLKKNSPEVHSSPHWSPLLPARS